MVLFCLAALAVGAVVGMAVAGDDGDSEEPDAGNLTDIYNSVLSRTMIKNTTTCSQSINQSQVLDIKCGPDFTDCDNICGTDSGGNPLPCDPTNAPIKLACLNNVAKVQETVATTTLGLRKTKACEAAVAGCCNNPDFTVEQCTAACRNNDAKKKEIGYACFMCVVSDVSQTQEQGENGDSLNLQCSQKSLTTATISAKMKAVTDQSNKIVQDGLAAMMGADAKANVAKITNKVNNQMDFDTAMNCYMDFEQTQLMSFTGLGYFATNLSQHQSNNAGIECTQRITNKGNLQVENTSTVKQKLDQELQSPFKVFTDLISDIFSGFTIGLILCGVMLVVAFPLLIRTLAKNGMYTSETVEGKDGKRKTTRKFNLFAILFIVLIVVAVGAGLAIYFTADTGVPELPVLVPAPEQQPVEMYLRATSGLDDFKVIAAGPLLIAMKESDLLEAFGNPTVNRLNLMAQVNSGFRLWVDDDPEGINADKLTAFLGSSANDTVTVEGFLYHGVRRKVDKGDGVTESYNWNLYVSGDSLNFDMVDSKKLSTIPLVSSSGITEKPQKIRKVRLEFTRLAGVVDVKVSRDVTDRVGTVSSGNSTGTGTSAVPEIDNRAWEYLNIEILQVDETMRDAIQTEIDENYQNSVLVWTKAKPTDFVEKNDDGTYYLDKLDGTTVQLSDVRFRPLLNDEGQVVTNDDGTPVYDEKKVVEYAITEEGGSSAVFDETDPPPNADTIEEKLVQYGALRWQSAVDATPQSWNFDLLTPSAAIAQSMALGRARSNQLSQAYVNLPRQ